jgi:outer membrane protein assembly factor BamB
VPAPVTWEGLVVVCPPKREKMLAWREGGQGDVTATHLAWKSDDLTSDVCVPLVYQGKLYVLDGDKKSLTCAEPATGTKIWSVPNESRSVMRGSPTAGDGKIYATNEDGEVFVWSAVDGKLLSKVALEAKGTRGSVALVDGMVVVRSADKVWAFGSK